MTPTEIEALIARWMAAQVSTIGDSLAETPRTENWFKGAEMVWSYQVEDLHEKMDACDYQKVSPEVDELLHGAGVAIPPHDSIEFKHLCRRLLRAKLELVEIERDRCHGVDPAGGLVPLGIAPMIAPVVVPQSLPFSVVAKKYLAEKPHAKSMGTQIEVEYAKFLKAIGGDRPIAQITKTDGRTYKDSLVERGISQATIAVKLHTLSGLFTWAATQGYTPEGALHPIRGLAPDKAERVKGALDFQPFSDEQLMQVFATPEFYKQRLQRPERYWVALICLFQLCRREEAAQLAVKDIGERDGIPFITITDLGENQSVKTPGSRRVLPIHSSLIALGFMAYIKGVKDQRHTQLFPQLKLVANRYGVQVGKWFATHLDRAGLPQPELRMHSLRHGTHYLHALGCPQDIAEMLTGHTANSVHNKYKHRELTKLARSQAGLEKMQFPEVLKALRESLERPL